jgi:hypothetical protein
MRMTSSGTSHRIRCLAEALNRALHTVFAFLFVLGSTSAMGMTADGDGVKQADGSFLDW